MIDEKHFDELWEKAEVEKYTESLSAEYPAWLRRRHQRRTALATVAVLVVAGFSIFNFQPSTSKDYDYVACNRSGIAEGHWAKVASNILTIETL